MIYMTHDTDNRRTLRHVLFILILFFQKLFYYIHFHFFFTYDLIFDGNLFCRFKADLLIYRYDLPLQEQFLHDNGRLYFHLICQLSDRKHLRQCNRLDLLFLFLFYFLLRFDESSRFVFILTVAIFIDCIFSGTSVSFLIDTAVVIPMLLRILYRRFRHERSGRSRFSVFIVLPAIASFRAVSITKAPATI